MTADFTMEPPHQWMQSARCREVDPRMWHPEPGHEQTSQTAREICHRCEVEGRCLEYAVMNDIRYGIYGGLTETERRRLRANDGTPSD
jgi:WhiB family transcriptional regulator, redox-sensing transcriptional regulator